MVLNDFCGAKLSIRLTNFKIRLTVNVRSRLLCF